MNIFFILLKYSKRFFCVIYKTDFIEIIMPFFFVKFQK